MVLSSCNKEDSTYIEKQKFNKDWSFILLPKSQEDSLYFQKAINDKNWEKVSLPHTLRVEPKIVNNQWQGICWYRKNFSLSKKYEKKKLWLKFDGAMNIAEVWVNGEKLMEHHGGYLPFVVDFTRVATFDEVNTIAVRLNNYDNPVTGPKPLEILDFNTYGGIYRNVWLIVKNPLHITDPILENKTAGGGIFVTCPEVSEDQAKVRVQTHIKNEGNNEASFIVQNTLLKGDSTVVSIQSEVQALSVDNSKEVVTEIEVVNPELWSPGSPNLYQLKTELIRKGTVVDQEITRIGIKTMKFEGQDFYLNGEKTFLRGVNRHQEYPYIGYALSDNAQYRDAKRIKEAGFDYVRLSHYPHAPAFMDACDELGIVTIDAILGWQYFSEDRKFQEQVFQTARDLIRRDRNHASVLAWEVSLNESRMPEAFIDSLTTIAHQEYPGDQCFTAGWQSYGYDIYLQARQHRLKHYDKDLAKPYNVSEYGDWEYYAMNAGLNQDSWNGLLQEARSSRQLRGSGEVRLLQQATNIQEAHNDNLSTPAFADGYWVMYDYNRGYANDLEASGIMDIFRIPKPAYYFYKSQRDADDFYGEPMVYIANDWKQNSPLNIRVFSNCEEVELLLNGISLGQQKPDQNRISNNLKHPPFTFHIEAFEAGKLEAKGYINNQVAATYVKHTPKAPSQIQIEMDGFNDIAFKEDSDVFFVHAYITDDNKTVIPDYKGKVIFTIEGDAEIIGESFINCEAGVASILLRTKRPVKDLKIKASSKNLSVIKSFTPDETVLQKVRVDSLSLLPKRFLKQENQSSGYCIVRGDSLQKRVALTFDDGPTDLSREIIKLLNKHSAKGTFFWLGENLSGKRDIIKFTKESGHLIGNHSWDHQNGWETPTDSLWHLQVERTNKEFQVNGIGSPRYFRPPFGAITQEQIDFLAKKGITTVLWSVTSMDWDETQNSSENMLQKFKEQLHNGAIVLFHDYDFGNSQEKLKAIEQIITYGKSLGYSFVTVEKLIN